MQPVQMVMFVYLLRSERNTFGVKVYFASYQYKNEYRHTQRGILYILYILYLNVFLYNNFQAIAFGNIHSADQIDLYPPIL